MIRYAMRKSEHRLLANSSNEHTAQQRSFAVSRMGATNAKDWLDEIFDFTSILSRRMHYTLSRIKLDFVRKGLKFDTDFRDHFLFIVNNRLAESFDSFLIQNPREMRTDDCTINRSTYAMPLNVPSIEPSRSSKGVKRKRPNSYRPSVDPDRAALGTPEKTNQLNGFIGPSPMVTVHTNLLQASNSNQTSSVSKSATTNGYNERVEIEVSKVSQTSTLTTLAMMKQNKNQSSSSLKTTGSASHIQNGQRELTANQNLKLTAKTLSLMNERERQIAFSKFPVVRIPKIQTNSAVQVNEKSVTPEETVKEMPKTKFNNGNKIKTPIATDHNYVRPKSRDCAVTQTRIASGQTLPTSVSNGVVMMMSRSSERNRPKITYYCDGLQCTYTSEVKSNYERHLLLHKSCMQATRNKQTLNPMLKMIMN